MELYCSFKFVILSNIMSALQILPHYTFDDWQHWEGRWEIIHGIPYAMSPAPIPKHQIIASALDGEFYIALKNCKHCKVMQPIDYKIADDIILQPDLLVACRPITKSYLDFAPSLVVEILSPATALKDKHTKFQLYEQQSIQYYIIVSPDSEEVEVYLNGNDGYELANKGHNFTYNFLFEDNCQASIDFNEIWK